MEKDTLGGIFTIVGTVIGAGVLGVPYALSKAGFLPSLLMLFGIGGAMILTNLYVGEMSLRTEDGHQLPGLAGEYLGEKGRYLMLVLFAFGVFGAMTAYLIGIGDDLAFIFPGNNFVYSLLFFIPASLIIMRGTEKVEESEIVLIPLLIAFSIFLAILLFPSAEVENLTYVNWDHFFFPYGVVLFALLGFSIVPEVREELKGNEGNMKKALILGILTCIGVYLVFSLAFLGAFGHEIDQIATESLDEGILKYLGFIFSAISMASSFLTLGLALKDMFIEDMHIKKDLAPILTLGPPLTLSLFQLGFIEIIEVTGGLLGALMGIVVCLSVLKSKEEGEREPEWQIKAKWPLYLLIAIFISGAIYELFFIF